MPTFHGATAVAGCENKTHFLHVAFPCFLEICHVMFEKTNWQIKSLMGQTSLSPVQGKKIFFAFKKWKKSNVLLWYHSSFPLITVSWEMEKLNTAGTCLCSSLLSGHFQTYSTVSFSLKKTSRNTVLILIQKSLE